MKEDIKTEVVIAFYKGLLRNIYSNRHIDPYLAVLFDYTTLIVFIREQIEQYKAAAYPHPPAKAVQKRKLYHIVMKKYLEFKKIVKIILYLHMRSQDDEVAWEKR